MKLLFVYNADAGVVSGIMDSIHKTLSPQTYECGLCQITYGLVSMDKTWREFLKSLPIETEFFHRKDFKAAHPSAAFDLPVILLSKDGRLSPLLTAQAIDSQKDVNALIGAMSQALAGVGIRASL